MRCNLPRTEKRDTHPRLIRVRRFPKGEWYYTAIMNLAAGADVTIEATAIDRAKDTATKQQPYHQP